MGNNNIILVGFMAVGKTTVGRLLAKRLDFKFLDTDLLIEENEGMSIPRIFESKGEGYFRKKESELLDQLKGSGGTIISTGGGMAVSEDNRRKLKDLGRVIYLEASPDWILKNLHRSNILRPLLSNEKDPICKIRQLLDLRRQYYEKASDIKVPVDYRSLDEIVNNIIFAIENQAE